MDEKKKMILIPIQVIEPIEEGEENEEENNKGHNYTINNHPDSITRTDPIRQSYGDLVRFGYVESGSKCTGSRHSV